MLSVHPLFRGTVLLSQSIHGGRKVLHLSVHTLWMTGDVASCPIHKFSTYPDKLIHRSRNCIMYPVNKHLRPRNVGSSPPITRYIGSCLPNFVP